MPKIWVEVPREAFVAAINALKDFAVTLHRVAREYTDAERAAESRKAADQADLDAEALRTGLREWESGKEPPKA